MTLQRLTMVEFRQLLKRTQGDELHCLDWAFICPTCGTVQSARLFDEAGQSFETVHRDLGINCIGKATQGAMGCAYELCHGALLHWPRYIVGPAAREYFAIATREQAETLRDEIIARRAQRRKRGANERKC